MFKFLKQLFQTIFSLILIGGIIYYVWLNYDFLSAKFFNNAPQDEFSELYKKYPPLSDTQNDFNFSNLNEIVLNLNLQSYQKILLIAYYQSLNDFSFKLKNHEFEKFEDAFKELREVLKESQCVFANIDLNETKEKLLIKPLDVLIKNTLLKTTGLEQNQLFSRISQTYMSEFLNLIYNDSLCKNEEIFKLYKELKNKEVKIIPTENKKTKELSLKDLLLGGEK